MIEHLRPLAVFAEVVRAGSFRGAASKLDLSPSVVSHHVSQLEARLGVTLLIRTTRNLSVTPEGASLASASMQMLEAAQTGLEELSGFGDNPVGRITVWATPALAGDHDGFVAHLSDFCALHERLFLSLDFRTTAPAPGEDEPDLTVQLGPPDGDHPDARPIGAVETVVCAAPDGLRAPLGEETPLLVLDLGPGGPFRPAQAGAERLRSTDPGVIRRICLMGGGLAKLPRFVVADDLKTGRLVEVPSATDEAQTLLTATTPSRRPANSLARLFCDFLQDRYSATDDGVSSAPRAAGRFA